MSFRNSSEIIAPNSLPTVTVARWLSLTLLLWLRLAAQACLSRSPPTPRPRHPSDGRAQAARWTPTSKRGVVVIGRPWTTTRIRRPGPGRPGLPCRPRRPGRLGRPGRRRGRLLLVRSSAALRCSAPESSRPPSPSSRPGWSPRPPSSGSRAWGTGAKMRGTGRSCMIAERRARVALVIRPAGTTHETGK